jgi:hypothetical protein
MVWESLPHLSLRIRRHTWNKKIVRNHDENAFIIIFETVEVDGVFANNLVKKGLVEHEKEIYFPTPNWDEIGGIYD